MMRVTKLLAAAAEMAAFASAGPAAAQYYPGYGSPYGYGANPYAYSPYANGAESQAVVGECANAVQARLNGGDGDDYGYGYAGGYGGARVLGISRVEHRYGGGMTVHGVATTGRAGGYGYTPNSPVDLVWRCSTDFRGAIVGIELPELYEDGATRRRARFMPRGRRVAHVGARRVIAMLILEHAVEYQELFAAAMGVRREMAVRRVAHDRCGARDLFADAVEHPPIDPGHGRGNPGQSRGVDHGALGEIGVQFHGRGSRRFGSVYVGRTGG